MDATSRKCFAVAVWQSPAKLKTVLKIFTTSQGEIAAYHKSCDVATSNNHDKVEYILSFTHLGDKARTHSHSGVFVFLWGIYISSTDAEAMKWKEEINLGSWKCWGGNTTRQLINQQLLFTATALHVFKRQALRARAAYLSHGTILIISLRPHHTYMYIDVEEEDDDPMTPSGTPMLNSHTSCLGNWPIWGLLCMIHYGGPSAAPSSKYGTETCLLTSVASTLISALVVVTWIEQHWNCLLHPLRVSVNQLDSF